MRLPTQLLRRNPDSHKGDFGHIFILAGSRRFSGAALLCCEAALRTGAGLVTLGIPKSLSSAIIKIKPKEVMLLPLPETDEATLNFGAYKNIRAFIREVDILVIGPGLSQNQQTRALVRKVIKDTAKPMIIDADGLNALSGNLGILNAKYKIILTPHPGEMARLMGKTIEVIQKKRKEFAKQFAQYYKLTVVLKGHNTVVADYKDNLYINKTGNPGMATAGSGDVLTGMIASFLGQGLEEFLAAKYAVYLHGLAGDLSAKKKTQLSLIASDIINAIPEAIRISSY